MNYGDAIRSVWANWSTFSGRARRAELLWWLASVLVSFAVVVAVVTGARAYVPLVGFGLLMFYLAMFWPTLSLGVRRLHDSGLSGLWMLLLLLPAIGQVPLLALLLIPGQERPNRFGPDPRGHFRTT